MADPVSRALAEVAQRLEKHSDFRPVIEQLSSSRIVMLGETVTGVSEFHRWRRWIALGCMLEHGFNLLVTDWSKDAAALANRYILGEIEDHDAWRLLHHLYHWPSWHWANSETAQVLAELRAFNAQKSPAEQVHWVGLGGSPSPVDTLDLLLLRADNGRAQRPVVWTNHTELASPRFGGAILDRYRAHGVVRVSMAAGHGTFIASNAPETPYESQVLPRPDDASWETLLDQAAELRQAPSILLWTDRTDGFRQIRPLREIGPAFDPKASAQAPSALVNECEAVIYARHVQPVEPVHVPFTRLDWTI